MDNELYENQEINRHPAMTDDDTIDVDHPEVTVTAPSLKNVQKAYEDTTLDKLVRLGKYALPVAESYGKANVLGGVSGILSGVPEKVGAKLQEVFKAGNLAPKEFELAMNKQGNVVPKFDPDSTISRFDPKHPILSSLFAATGQYDPVKVDQALRARGFTGDLAPSEQAWSKVAEKEAAEPFEQAKKEWPSTYKMAEVGGRLARDTALLSPVYEGAEAGLTALEASSPLMRRLGMSEYLAPEGRGIYDMWRELPDAKWNPLTFGVNVARTGANLAGKALTHGTLAAPLAAVDTALESEKNPLARPEEALPLAKEMAMNTLQAIPKNALAMGVLESAKIPLRSAEYNAGRGVDWLMEKPGYESLKGLINHFRFGKEYGETAFNPVAQSTEQLTPENAPRYTTVNQKLQEGLPKEMRNYVEQQTRHLGKKIEETAQATEGLPVDLGHFFVDSETGEAINKEFTPMFTKQNVVSNTLKAMPDTFEEYVKSSPSRASVNKFNQVKRSLLGDDILNIPSLDKEGNNFTVKVNNVFKDLPTVREQEKLLENVDVINANNLPVDINPAKTLANKVRDFNNYLENLRYRIANGERELQPLYNRGKLLHNQMRSFTNEIIPGFQEANDAFANHLQNFVEKPLLPEGQKFSNLSEQGVRDFNRVQEDYTKLIAGLKANDKNAKEIFNKLFSYNIPTGEIPAFQQQIENEIIRARMAGEAPRLPEFKAKLDIPQEEQAIQEKLQRIKQFLRKPQDNLGMSREQAALTPQEKEAVKEHTAAMAELFGKHSADYKRMGIEAKEYDNALHVGPEKYLTASALDIPATAGKKELLSHIQKVGVLANKIPQYAPTTENILQLLGSPESWVNAPFASLPNQRFSGLAKLMQESAARGNTLPLRYMMLPEKDQNK